MLMKKLQSIMGKLSKNYMAKLTVLTLFLLLIVIAMLESKTSEIPFVYNNF